MTDDGWLDVEIDTGPPGLVRVAGEVDIDTAEAFAEAVAKLTRDGQAVHVDLSRVTFIDSSGIAVLIDAVNAGHSVHVRNPSDAVRRVLEASGLTRSFHVDD